MGLVRATVKTIVEVARDLSINDTTPCSGSGGGFLIIPALVLLLSLPMTVAVGTSLLIIVVNSAAWFTAHAGDAALDYPVMGAFTVAAVVESLAAARLASRLPAERLGAGSPTSYSLSPPSSVQAVINPDGGG